MSEFTELYPISEQKAGLPHPFLACPKEIEKPPPKEVRHKITPPEVINHNHFRFTNELLGELAEPVRQELEKLGFEVDQLVLGLLNCKEGQLTVEQAVGAAEILKNTLKDYSPQLVLTEHGAQGYVVKCPAWDKFEGKTLKESEETVKFLSAVALARQRIIEASGLNIMVGMEADILDQTGRLDITDEVFAQINGPRIASLHVDEFESASGKQSVLENQQREKKAAG